MPSFDVVSEVDHHELRNALDQANREIGTRYDFKGSNANIEQAGNQLQAGVGPSISCRAKVSGQWLVPILQKSRWNNFVGFASHHKAEHLRPAPVCQKVVDFLLHVRGLTCRRRAQHQQELALIQRRLDGCRQVA